jgi:hypothetical protein
MFSNSPRWIGDRRKIRLVKIKPVHSRVFRLLQLDKVELSCHSKKSRHACERDTPRVRGWRTQFQRRRRGLALRHSKFSNCRQIGPGISLLIFQVCPAIGPAITEYLNKKTSLVK